MNAKEARPVDDPKALVPFGWAPGGYYCRACATCGEAHSGSDKRSIRCQDCAEALRDAPTPMTPPMTPREKVELKSCPFCGNDPSVSTYETESLWSHDQVTYTKVSCDECDIAFSTEPGHDPQAFEAWNRRTALASGSGDHAELARLAEAATAGVWNRYVSGAPEYNNETHGLEVGEMGPLICGAFESEADCRFVEAAQPSVVLALLAENAALRAERVHLVEQKEGAEDALFNALSRATEAERKLAEAVSVLREIAEGEAPPEQHGHYLAHRKAVDAARNFLSKEPA